MQKKKKIKIRGSMTNLIVCWLNSKKKKKSYGAIRLGSKIKDFRYKYKTQIIDFTLMSHRFLA